MKFISADSSKDILSPQEKDDIKSLDYFINRLSTEQKSTIEDFFENFLKSNNQQTPLLFMINNIELGFSSFFPNTTWKYFLEWVINFPQSKPKILDAHSDNLISEKTKEFILKICFKYGLILKQIIEIQLNAEKWKQISSKIQMTDNFLNINSKIIRVDGKHFIFDTDIKDSLLLISHYLDRLVDISNNYDKKFLSQMNPEKVVEIRDKSTMLLELLSANPSISNKSE